MTRKRYTVVASFAIALALVISVFAAPGVASVRAQGAYLPPYSIYGAPTVPSSQGVLNATGEYWGPYTQSIYFTWFTTSEAIVEAILNGYIQYDAGGVDSIQLYNQFKPYVQSGQVAINETPSNSFGYLGFNVHVYPFSNVHFRRAIQHLTNYQEIASYLYNGILGIASPYYFFPSVYGSDFSPQEAQAYQQLGAFSLTAAVQELELAGLVDHPSQGYWTFANGTRVPTLTIYTSSGTGFALRQQILSVITTNAAAINLSISIVPVNFNTFIDSLLPTGSYEMYNIGWILGAPVNPTWVYFIFGPYPLNTFYQNYDNQTVWQLSTKLLTDSATFQQAQEYAQQVGVALQQDLPYVILDWGVTLTPVRVDTWKAYISEAPYGILFPFDIHPANATFGTLYRFGQPQAPDTQNIYTMTSLYDFQIHGNEYSTPLQVAFNNPVALFPSAAYNYSVSNGVGVMPNGHHWNGTVITMDFLPNQVFWDGVPATAIDYNFTLWWLDVGGFSSNPYNPSQDTVTIDPGVVVNYTAEAANPGLEWFGAASGFVGSYVPPDNPYQITLYFNTTSVYNLLNVYSDPILPEHIFGKIQPSSFASESAPQYLSQEVYSGPYEFGAWSQSANYAQLYYFPSFYLANPLSYTVSASQGTSATFTMSGQVFTGATSTSAGYTAVTQPVANATGTVYVLNSQTLAPVASYPLSYSGNGMYTANIPTSSLAVGSYTLVGVLNWTGPSYMYFGGGSTSANQYTLHEYGTLTVTPPVTTSTSTTSTSFTPPSPTTTSSSSSTTSTSSFSAAEALVIALIVIAIIAVAIGAARRQKPAA